MANNKNLEKGKATQFKAGEKQVEIARRGGIASGEAKRLNKSFRSAAIAALEKTYEEDGQELTGYDKMLKTLLEVAVDKDNKNCISAMRFVREIVGENVTAEEMRMMKKKMEQMDADIEYRKKATKELEWR